MIGTRLGHYQIERMLGRGGMGDVYLAHDTKLNRRVALKVLSRELAADIDRRDRFEREARAVAALNHPNIVTIHSVEEFAGTPFLTLELIDGQTLADIIPGGGLPLDRVLDLSIPLADGVGAAHQRAITHRDLKPTNVMITGDGRVKILDFGLAKVAEEIRVAETTMPTAALTGEGRIVGTVAYMSPEQAEAKPVDQRSDVFSLGVILYEMVTGVRPFQGDTQMSTLSSIIKDTPRPLAELRRGLPRDVSRIVNRCLAKDPEDRYQSAKDLRNDLRALKRDLASGDVEPGPGPGSPSSRSAGARYRWSAGIVAGVAMLGIVAAVVFWTLKDDRGSGTTRRPFDSIRLTRLTTSGTATQAAMSQDGRYVAYVSMQDGKQSLWLRQIAAASNVEVAKPDGTRYLGLNFAPDGNHLYYIAAQEANAKRLYEIPILGGGARLVLANIDSPVTFSPDGRQLAFVRSDAAQASSSVIVATLDGTQQRALSTRNKPKRFLPFGLAWSPDGKSIAVTGRHDEELRGELVIVNAEGSKETVLATPEWRQVTAVAWLPDGKNLLANAQESSADSSTHVFLVAYPSGSARRLTSDLSSYLGASLAPDGKSFVSIRNDRRAALWTMPLDDPSKAAAVTSEATGDEGGRGLTWAPDGRIVYTSEANGNPDIWIMNADGSRRVQLTMDPAQEFSPRVTPDGRQIVFVSDRDRRMRLWRMGVDGRDAAPITSEIVSAGSPSISGDGQWIYYDATGGESRRVSIDGGRSEPVFSADVRARVTGPFPHFHQPMPSPDGSAIAAHEVFERGERIVVIPSAGGTLKRFDSVPASGTWSPDGNALIYTDTSGGVSNLMRQPLAGGRPTPLTTFTSDEIFRYAVSRDQKQVALVRGRISSDVVLVSDTR